MKAEARVLGLCLGVFMSSGLAFGQVFEEPPPPKGEIGVLPMRGDTVKGQLFLSPSGPLPLMRGALSWGSLPGEATGQDLQLIEAAEAGDLATLEALIKAGADVNARDYIGETALMHAALNGNVAIVKALIDAGADVNAATSEWTDLATRRWTALMLAAEYSHPDVVEALIQGGADVNARDSNGKTALMYAAEIGDVAVVKALIQAGADVNAATRGWAELATRRWTALMFAAANGNVAIAKALIDAGADVNAKDRNGNTALSIANKYDKGAVVNLLIAAGAR